MGLPVFVVSLRDATLDGVTGVQPCVGLTKGLNALARMSTCNVVLELTLVYLSQARLAYVRAALPVKDMQAEEGFDARTVLVEAVIKAQTDGTPVPQPDERGTFTASARLVVVTQQGSEELVEPTTTQGLVGAAEALPG